MDTQLCRSMICHLNRGKMWSNRSSFTYRIEHFKHVVSLLTHGRYVSADAASVSTRGCKNRFANAKRIGLSGPSCLIGLELGYCERDYVSPALRAAGAQGELRFVRWMGGFGGWIPGPLSADDGASALRYLRTFGAECVPANREVRICDHWDGMGLVGPMARSARELFAGSGVRCGSGC